MDYCEEIPVCGLNPGDNTSARPETVLTMTEDGMTSKANNVSGTSLTLLSNNNEHNNEHSCISEERSLTIDERCESPKETLLKNDQCEENVIVEHMQKSEDTEHENTNIDIDQQTILYHERIMHNFDFSQPYQITGAWKCFKVVSEMNYTRGCKWSPDGSCLLTNSDDNCLRLFNLPEILYKKYADWSDVQEMTPALSIQQNELIYDFCWYPNMSSLDSATCCLVSSGKSNPVHMWDAFTGELRCTYRPYNHLDEVAAAHSLAFDPTGSYLFTGFNRMIRYFDVSVPGRKFEEIPTRCERQGQNGIVSCMAFNPENPTQFAAGSYSRTIGVYNYSRKKLVTLLEGQSGGVTQLLFSPDGTKLYSGARMDPEILCWDLRHTKQVLFSMLRMVITNQRMNFDISSCGRYLISGNNNGVVTVWDTNQTPKLTTGYLRAILEPMQYFTAHSDCTNGISLHRSLPVLATTSGQRKFPEVVDDSDDESMFAFTDQSTDNSLRLWWIGSHSEETFVNTVVTID